MKILKILFANLNSLRGEFAIDLTAPAFVQNGIFAITGPTGAGKSTILDAVCLALYSKTPRQNDVGGNNEIMSRTAGSCRAQVFFTAGGQYYLASFEQHRARNKAGGALQNKTHKLLKATADLQPGAEIDSGRSVPARVAEITGLDFDKFTKAILLSQGNFASFLKADPNQRAELLEKLTGTTLYSRISSFVFAKNKEAQDELAKARTGLEAIELMDEETERAKQDELASLEEQAQQLAAAQTEVSALLQRQQELQQLHTAVTELKAAQLEQQQAIQNFAPQAQLLEKAAQAAPLKPLLEQLTALTQEQTSQLQDLKRLTDKEAELQQDLQSNTQKSAQAAADLARADAAVQDFQKIAPQIFALDEALSSAREELTAQQEQAQRTEQELKQAQAEFIQAEKQAEKAAHAAFKCQNYLNVHASNAELFERNARTRTQLEQLSSKIEDLGRSEENLADLTQQRTLQQKDLTKLLKKQTAAQNALTQAQQARTQAAEAAAALLQGRTIAELRAARDFCTEVLPALQRLTELKNKAEELKQAQEQTAQNQADAAARKDEAVKQLEILERELKSAVQARDSQQQIYTLKQKVMSLNEQRRQLTDGQPCPLCGSLHHPYILSADLQWSDADEQELKKRQALVQDLERRQRALELARERARTELAHQAAQTQQLSADLSALMQELTEQEAAVQGLSQGLSDASVLNAYNLTPDSFTGAAADTAAAVRRAKMDLTSLISRAEDLNQTAQSSAQQEQSALQSLHDLEVKVSAARTALDLAVKGEDAQRLQVSAEHQAIFTAISDQAVALAMTVHLAPQPTAADYAVPLNELTQGLQHFEHLAEEYKQHSSKLITLKEEQGAAENKRSQAKLQQQHAEAAVTKAHAQCDKLRQQEAILQQERTALCAAPDAQIYLQSLSAAAAGARTACEQLKQLETQLREQIADISGKQSAAQRQLDSTVKKLTEAQAGLTQELTAHGFASTEELQQILDVPADDLQALQQEQEQLQRQSIELAAALQEKTDAAHKLSETLQGKPPLSQTQEQLEHLKKQLTALAEHKGELTHELAVQAQNKARRQQELARITALEQRAQRYGSLNHLIGSADGKTYRRFFQTISLEILTVAANQQLARLTDRYQLVRCESPDERRQLDLEVIDLYQFSVRRPTSNLSGGETFLVSLALALGLSKMASAAVQVNSLFLDEGFGSLDDEALDGALNTLAALQREGKLIGVISHINKVKDRIAAQIEVRRLSGGFSTISGAGCSARPGED